MTRWYFGEKTRKPGREFETDFFFLMKRELKLDGWVSFARVGLMINHYNLSHCNAIEDKHLVGGRGMRLEGVGVKSRLVNREVYEKSRAVSRPTRDVIALLLDPQLARLTDSFRI